MSKAEYGWSKLREETEEVSRGFVVKCPGSHEQEFGLHFQSDEQSQESFEQRRDEI